MYTKCIDDQRVGSSGSVQTMTCLIARCVVMICDIYQGTFILTHKRWKSSRTLLPNSAQHVSSREESDLLRVKVMD